ncbi:MAG: cupin-like domain-containing protein [Rubrivivax sp.]|nr:cupin-like domain-containing protein [Rubrivivax sp.]
MTSTTRPLAAPTASQPAPAPPARYHIRFERPQDFSTRRVQALRHDYDRHPLMQLESLARLAKELYPTRQCRFIAPGTRQTSSFTHGDKDNYGRSIDEVFARIEEPGSWIALYNVETQPAYRAFLGEVIDGVRPLIEREQPGIFNVGGFIFISAPPSVTPFHMDRENNFWLQIRGRKVMNVWDPTDRHVVAAPDRDAFIVYADLEPVQLREGFVERSHAFDVGAGDGVYFPSTSPHMTRSDPDWVRPGDGVSVSIGVVFYTDVTRREANAHAWNLFLRQLGWSPRDVGESAWLDRLKHPLGRALLAAKVRFRGHRMRVGF